MPSRVALGQLCQDRRGLNISAITSLDEGLEETLTLHCLGLFPLWEWASSPPAGWNP
jgi:hypothetical protein